MDDSRRFGANLSLVPAPVNAAKEGRLVSRLSAEQLAADPELARSAERRGLEVWLVEPGGAASVPAASVSAASERRVTDAAVRRAVELMQLDVKRRWTVSSLAKAVGLSRAAFARRFAAALGASPIAHLTELRLAVAARLLRDGDASLAEVATRVGYESEFAFSRAFKRAYGLPPATFRRAPSFVAPRCFALAA